jgi:acetyl-CoA carboxylase biotin carboxyl carrier protein
MNEPSIAEVAALLDQFDRSDWNEIVVTGENFSLRSYKTPTERTPVATAGARAAATVAPHRTTTALDAVAPPVAAAPATATPAEPVDREGMVVVRAPNLGTFYRSSKPGSPPFVEIGQHVEETTDICLIEVMKLFTPVQAGVAGIVREILVADAELVEFDEPLVVIEPSG